MSELFNSDVDQDIPEIDPEKDYEVELVGDGKKFGTTKDLARGKAEADAHILRLQKENKKFRDEATSKANLETLINQIKEERLAIESGRTSRDGQNRGEPEDPELNNSTLTTEAVRELINQTLAGREQGTTEQSNINKVMDAARSIFGDGFNKELKARLDSFGLDEQTATQLAKTKPDAFIKIFNLNGKKDEGLFAPPTTRVSTTSGSFGTRRNWKYYQKLRKDQGENAWNNAMPEMLKNLEELGEEAFYA